MTRRLCLECGYPVPAGMVRHYPGDCAEEGPADEARQPGIDDYRDALALTRAAAHNNDTEVRAVLTHCERTRTFAALCKLYLGQLLFIANQRSISADDVLDVVAANVEEAFARQDEQ